MSPLPPPHWGEGHEAVKPVMRYALTILALLAVAWIAFHLR
ncbi:hypothetical protein [Methylobacterium aerolatum]|uniref:RimJ/RimL family protein N-acetyltransferase n=1 Tax=Methylobacterium aerolatum TaxID=418708 RepID=A0ABU0I6R8_9HYPH|nr:hypothetical protein [Methylobacterium aerolatum]MDQ0449396.1 RimJ/RimL family protein N-acetyltransferase [Methylobacterium aerolatum]